MNRILLILLTALLTSGTVSAQGNTRIAGKTQKVTQAAGQIKYDPLPEVKIEVFRLGPVLPQPAGSDKKGDFKIDVPSGTPFRVLFYLDDKTVPELQNLTGEQGVLHQFNVGLLTVTEYNKLASMEQLPRLKKHLAGILAVLPENSKAYVLIKNMHDRSE